MTLGSLPTGLSLDAASGAITGIPTAAGTFNFTITATNTTGVDADPFQLVVNGAGVDTTPNPFTFIDAVGVALSSTITSNAVTITGINAAAPVSVVGGEYSIGCTGTFTSVPATIANNQAVCVRHVSSALALTPTSTTLNVGGVSDTFTSTTLFVAPPPPPPGDPTQPIPTLSEYALAILAALLAVIAGGVLRTRGAGAPRRGR